jgi:hypothetical protein
MPPTSNVPLGKTLQLDEVVFRQARFNLTAPIGSKNFLSAAATRFMRNRSTAP